MEDNQEMLGYEELVEIFEAKDYDRYPKEHIALSAKSSFKDMIQSANALKDIMAPPYNQEHIELVVNLLSELGDSGCDIAYYELGLLFYNCKTLFQNGVQNSLAYHYKAAQMGNADAMFELYIYYAEGIGTDVNMEVSTMLCTQSASLGNIRAMYNMGTMYATGDGVEQDDAECVEWYQKAAMAGHSKAALTLGVMYSIGSQVECDKEEGEKYFQLAEELGADVDEFISQFGIER